MIRSALAALLLAAALDAGAAGFSDQWAGTAAAQFLQLGADARAEGMGEAARSVTEDANAVYWNPAGLASLDYRHATATHGLYYQSIFYDYLAYAQPVRPVLSDRRERELRSNDEYGAFGVGLLYLNAGQISAVDNTGAPTGESFTPQDAAVMAAWGAPVTENFDVGVGGKYISERIKESAETAAFDAGARLHFYLGDVPYVMSATVQNVGGRLRFIESGDELPLTFALGNSVRIGKGLTLAADIVAPKDGAVYPAVGGEYRYSYDSEVSVAMRLGYDGRTTDAQLDGFTGLTLGAGFTYARFGFDYAWAPFGVLGDTNRLSISYRF